MSPQRVPRASDANGMPRRPASRRRVTAGGLRCNAANIRLLYSACSRITCCLTRKSEVYKVHHASALAGRAAINDLGGTGCERRTSGRGIL